MQAYKDSEGTALLILNHGAKRSWVFNITPRPLSPSGKDTGAYWIDRVGPKRGLNFLQNRKFSGCCRNSNHRSPIPQAVTISTMLHQLHTNTQYELLSLTALPSKFCTLQPPCFYTHFRYGGKSKQQAHVNFKHSRPRYNKHKLHEVFIHVEMNLTDMRYGLRGPWKWLNKVQWQTRGGTAQSVQWLGYWFDSRQGKASFLLPTTCRPAPRTTQIPIHYVPEFFLGWQKDLGVRGWNYHTPPATAEVPNQRSYTITLWQAFTACKQLYIDKCGPTFVSP
jgi:hypothetical protein